jgi:hypothetical protein
MGRQVALAGIVAAWSLVVATPLFATVGLQTQVDRPPTRLEDTRQAVVRTWVPQTWDAQRATFAPDKTVATVAGPPPYTRLWLNDRWPEVTWDAQRVRQTPIPDRHDPPAYSFPLLVDRWPQPEWPTHITRKTPIPDAVVVAGTPFVRQYLQDRWPPLDWDSQTTKKTPIPDQHDRAAFSFPLLTDRWPQSDWDTQQTRKAPIPNAVILLPQIPYSLAPASPILLWPQPDWPSQVTRKSPIPDRHDPPAYSAPLLVDRWPQLTWESQQNQKQIQEFVAPQIDNPPGGQRLWLMPIVASWDPGPPQPIVRRVVWTPDGPPSSPTLDEAWIGRRRPHDEPRRKAWPLPPPQFPVESTPPAILTFGDTPKTAFVPEWVKPDKHKPRGTYRGLVYRPSIETTAPEPVVSRITKPTIQVSVVPAQIVDDSQEKRRLQRRRDEDIILALLMQDEL